MIGNLAAKQLMKSLDLETELINKMRALKQNQIELQENLVLGPDIYSLAMYGFYRTPFNKEGLLGDDKEKSKAIQEFRDNRNKLNYQKVTLVFGL